MIKRLSAVLAVILVAGVVNYAAAGNDKPQTWKGVVTLLCAAPAGTAASSTGDTCRLTLVSSSDKKVYVLDPQARMAKYVKKSVAITGTLSSAAKIKMATENGVVDASTIQVASITPASGS